MPVLPKPDFIDNDLYNFTMGQLIHEQGWGDRVVRYEFINRTADVNLADFLNPHRLRDQLEEMALPKIAPDERVFLSSLGISREYVNRLAAMTLPVPEVSTEDGRLSITYEGRWDEAIFWETPILAMINEYYYKIVGSWTGHERLEAKVNLLQRYPEIRVMEFGTRRRNSSTWQDRVVRDLVRYCPDNLVGTSNVKLARRYGIPAMGTMAHQLFMVHGADADSRESLIESQQAVADAWLERYPDRATLLPDTFTTTFALSNLKNLGEWKGIRQDSGDPSAVAQRVIEAWNTQGVDPKEKTLVFSDGLDLPTMIYLHGEFAPKVGQVLFGWGTDLTNDFNRKALNIVIKPTQVDGKPIVKLSDEPNKATGDTTRIEEIRSWI